MNKHAIKAVAIIATVTMLSHCASTDFVTSALSVLKVSRVVCTELRSLETHLQSTLDASVEPDASTDVDSSND